jgi:hypothetical protein
MGWDNLIKCWMGRQLIEYLKQHTQNENIKLQAKEWGPNMIHALWEHMLRVWQYRNDALHEDDNKRVTQFKVEALDRAIERLMPWHEDLLSKLHGFLRKRHTPKGTRRNTTTQYQKESGIHGGLTYYNLGVSVQILYGSSESYMCRYVRRKGFKMWYCDRIKINVGYK